MITEKIMVNKNKQLTELLQQRVKTDQIHRELSEKKDETENLQTELLRLQKELLQARSSIFWKIKQPLSKLTSKFPKFSRNSKRILKQVKWIITFQLLSKQSKNRDSLISEEFDKELYLKWNPDVVGSGIDAYTHFVIFGKSEGRAGMPISQTLHKKSPSLCKEKETVLVVCHEASRSGAPILGWNICRELKSQFNVIALLFGGGDLLSFYNETCDIVGGPYKRNYRVMFYIINQLNQQYKIKFAIVNSIESRYILPALATEFIPSVLLIHEFFAYSRPQCQFVDALIWAGRTVFSAKIIQENAINDATKAMVASSYILPQGKSLIPVKESSKDRHDKTLITLKEQIFTNNDTKPFIVLGAGGIYYRKGVDLFIATALEVKRLYPKSNIIMLWFGHGFDPELDIHYSAYLSDQIERSNLQDRFKIINEVANLEEVYQMTDLFFLSSRLDPLPNVAIDVMKYGIPVICFDKTTGIAEFLEKEEETATCIIPFMNIGLAAKKIIDFYQSSEYRSLVSKKIKVLSETNFNMECYVTQLVKHTENLSFLVNDEKQDCTILENSKDFNESFFAQQELDKETRQYNIRKYIRYWYSGCHLRKPTPGFNPELYAKYHNLSAKKTEPFVHYIQSGKPKGPWQDELITPIKAFKSTQPQLRCAVHIHVFYPSLLKDILDRFQFNQLQCDLFISVASEEIAIKVNKLLSDYNKGHCEVRIVPNRGRDIGPFLTEFKEKLQEYEVIGHFHTKRSLDIKNRNAVKTWVKFLLENLIGSEHSCMADQIINLFKKESSLGLVFADDPSLLGWGKNKPYAEQLGSQLGLMDLPDCCFNFPVGTMFWARPKALKPLFDLEFSWDMYPEEPLPYDGSLLHAIERLLPLVTEKQQFKRAVVYTPGLTR